VTEPHDDEHSRFDLEIGDPVARSRAAADRGRQARAVVPRQDQRDWAPSPGRADPVGLLLAQDETRSPDLVPVRHGRMSASAFTFYRGAAAIMAADLATTPSTGLRVQLCGDAHLSNLGAFASPERRLLFDLNDFDETLPGPWEWDLKRLSTSFVIAARDNGFSRSQAKESSRTVARAYRRAMRSFAGSGVLETWYARADAEEVAAVLSAGAGRTAKKATEKALAKARSRTSLHVLEKLTETVDGRVRFMDQSPLVVPLRCIGGLGDPAELEERVRSFFGRYRESLADPHRWLLDGYRMVDIAHKVVGVGSVGTRAFIALLLGRSTGDPLVLQFKEATTSVLEPHLGRSAYASSGERVVQGQRLMQAASDVFLGWTTADDGRHYYWRQLKDMKGSAEIAAMSPRALRDYAGMCGWSLARAHARSGDCVAIAAYLGGGSTFDEAVTAFSVSYADQNEADYAAHQQAVADGRVPVRLDV
jgi:uncharacterized protein (DUF2252 family)